MDDYKRDVFFVLHQELSGIDDLSMFAGKAINPDRPLVYNVDRMDRCMEKYDLLPTFDAPFVRAHILYHCHLGF